MNELCYWLFLGVCLSWLGCELHCVPDIHSPSLCPPAGEYRSPSILKMQCQRVVILRGAIYGIQRLRNSGNMAYTFMQSVATLSPFVLRCSDPSCLPLRVDRTDDVRVRTGANLGDAQAMAGLHGQGSAELQWARATTTGRPFPGQLCIPTLSLPLHIIPSMYI